MLILLFQRMNAFKVWENSNFIWWHDIRLKITLYSVDMFLLTTYFCRKLYWNIMLKAIIKLSSIGKPGHILGMFLIIPRFFLGNFMKLNLLTRRMYKSKRDFPFTFCPLPPFLPASNNSVFCHQLDREAFFFSYW